MICPHCQNDTEQPRQAVSIMKPAKVKNLFITSWCPDCKKPKSWSGNVAFGDVGDTPEYTNVPEICYCSLYQPVVPGWPLTLTFK